MGNIVDSATLAVEQQPVVTVEPASVEAPDIILVESNVKNFNLNSYLIFFGMVSLF